LKKMNSLKYKYRIKYNYNTGDSFNQYENQIDYLDGEYENLAIADENVKRILEHYKFYKNLNKHYNSQKENEKILEEAKKQRWYTKNRKGWGSENETIVLLADNGQEYQILAPWCGYFESLNSVQIEPISPPELQEKFVDF